MAKKVKHTIYTTDYNEEDWRNDYAEVNICDEEANKESEILDSIREK